MTLKTQTQPAEANKYAVNQAIGQYPGIGWVPVNQFVYWILIGALVFGCQILLRVTPLHFGLEAAFFSWCMLCLAYWALTGSKEHQFWDKFRALNFLQDVWILGKVRLEWTLAGLPQKRAVGKIGNVWQKFFNKAEVFTAIEDYSKLDCYGQINLQSYKVGFYLLKNRLGQHRFVFRWRVHGFHPTMSESDAEKALKAWETGVPEFPAGEEVTFDFNSFTDDKQRQAELDELLETDNELSQALIYSQKRRTRQLTKKGIRKVKDSFVTITYTPGLAGREDTDILSRLLKAFFQIISNFWMTFTGQKEELNHQQLHKMVSIAFKEGFLRAHSILTNLMETDAVPCTAWQNWSDDYAEHHKEPPPPIPQLIILDETGLKTEGDDEYLHASTVLFQGEKGVSSVPLKNPEWVYLPVREKYVGFMQLGRVKDYVSAHNKVRYFWNIVARERFYDSRIVVQFTSGNQGLQKYNLERSIVNSSGVALRAMQRRTVDTAAEDRATEAIRAQREINQGKKVVFAAAGIFLYRNNPQALDQDFATMADWFPGTAPYRERNMVPRIWLQSLPYVDEGFLRLPNDRRDEYLSKDATGLLAGLTSTKVLDDKGFEMVALEGGSPIYLDVYDPEKHWRIFIAAEPRSGKSLWQADYAAQAYLRGQPVIGFDVPRPTDGSSTYFDLTERINECGGKAAYYDSGSKSNNLLHLYDFSGLSKVEERQNSLQTLRIKATTAIGMGELEDPAMEQAMTSIVTQSLADFDAQPQIIQRFAAANAAGIGTPEWRNSPTYHDYAAFLKPWLENYFRENRLVLPAKYREAGGMLLQQLLGILKSKMGRAIAEPSDFANDTDMLIFALRLDSNYEARIMALAAYSALIGRALSCEVSHLLVDESPILFRWSAISNLIGEVCANGPKWGVRIIISGQNAETIFRSAAGPQIFQTLNAILIGRIAAPAKKSFVELLRYDPDLLEMCIDEKFKPSAARLRSHWLLYTENSYIPCGHHISELLISLTANNLPEAAARQRVMEKYKHRPLEGTLEFSRLYSAAKQTGTPMSEIHPHQNQHLRAS